MIAMLAKGDQASVVITGPGGLGKSYTVSEALRKAGLKDVTSLEEYEVGATINNKKVFRVIKGYSTPKGLYRALYENRDSVLVFDDTDSVLRDPVSLSLLKAALDSYSKRYISWRADLKDEDLPTVFEFTGRVVFISNMSSNQLDQAIVTRSMCVDLSMTAEQKIERMRHLIASDTFMQEYKMAAKVDALNLIDTLRDKVKELSLRTLIQCTKIRASTALNKWHDLAEYTICG
jgi:ethanolamine utilization cobalamin adenosyltransferase